MILPTDIKQTCLWIVRGQKRREQWYREQSDSILNGSPSPPDTYSRSNQIGNPVAVKAERLLKLEQSKEYRRLLAVNAAIETIGNDLPKPTRERLKKAILLNCESGRKFPFERLDLTEFSRRDFYRRKEKFLVEVAKNIGFL